MKSTIFFMAILSLVILSCKKDIVVGELSGTVKYGKGDCMPTIGPVFRTYEDYNGSLYFIRKSEIDKLANRNFDDLKAKSIRTSVNDGYFKINLPIDTFLVMPTDVYLYDIYNTVVVKEGVAQSKEFAFFKCTSY